MLAPEEKINIDNYNRFAEPRVDQHTDTKVFDSEFPKFQQYLPNGKVLEVGCGGCRDGIKISNSGYDYIGADVSQGLIDVARKKYPDLELYNQSIYGLRFPDNEFDGFWCAATLIHLPKRRIYEALGNIRRVLKPNGVGFIALKKGFGDMVHEEELIDGETFIRYFSYYQDEEFLAILKKARFSVLEHSALPVSQKTTWLNFIVQKQYETN